MDAMALLCNLHADGPATLRRLRAFGVGTLEDLHGRDIAELARLIEVSPAQARRFVREAGQLRERLGPDSWDPEEGEEAAPSLDLSAGDQLGREVDRNDPAESDVFESGAVDGGRAVAQPANDIRQLDPLQSHPIPIPSGVREERSQPSPRELTHEEPSLRSASTAPSASIPRSPEPLTSSTPLPSETDSPRLESEARPAGAVLAGDSTEESSGRLSARDRELLDQVLRRWRGGAKPQPAGSAAGSVAEEEPSLQPTAAAVNSTEASATDWLTAGRVSGLGIPQIEKLELAGIRTFTALAECDPLSLSKTSGMAFSTLQRLKFLAGRAPAPAATPAPAGLQVASGVERLSHSERPPMQSGTGGHPGEPSVGTLMEALSPRQPGLEGSAFEDLPSSYGSNQHLDDEEPSLADLLPHEDEGPGGPFA